MPHYNSILKTTAAAALVACAAPALAAVQISDNVTFSGFGTLGAVHSSSRNADFQGSVFQADGVGFTRRTSADVDSRLGGQLNAVFGEKFSGVLQVLSQYRHDGSYLPVVEWANVKYQVTPAFSVRLGRIAAPTSMMSETRFVGYANPWIRPPIETYSIQSTTSNDGIDASYRLALGSTSHTVQAFYGKTKARAAQDTTIDSGPNWGLNDTVEIGSLTLRAGYNKFVTTVNSARQNALFIGLRNFAAGAQQVPLPEAQAAAARALALDDQYKFSDVKMSLLALGFNYDPGTWFVLGEFVDLKGSGLISDSRSWYLTGGYRLGNFTPYVTYASLKADIQLPAGIPTAGLPPALAGGAAALSGGLNMAIAAVSPTQSTASVGLRWDAVRNVAIKAQYDRLKTGEGSNGRLVPYTGFVPGSSLNLYSVVVDFVF